MTPHVWQRSEVWQGHANRWILRAKCTTCGTDKFWYRSATTTPENVVRQDRKIEKALRKVQHCDQIVVRQVMWG